LTLSTAGFPRVGRRRPSRGRPSRGRSHSQAGYQQILLARDPQVCSAVRTAVFELSKIEGITPRPSCSSCHRRSPPPFRTRPCRSGRAPSTVFWLLLSFHNRRPNHPLARGHSSQQYRRRRLRISSLLWLDSTVWCPICHHIRQRGTVHFQSVVRPLLHPGHLPRADDCLPPAIKRVGGAVSPPTQGSTTGQGCGAGLVATPPLGPSRHTDGGTVGRGAVAGRGSHGLPAYPTRRIPHHRRAAAGGIFGKDED
jgi:hypothetical protein